MSGGGDSDIEIQVLQGLGDDLKDALAAHKIRTRVYCPVGDLVMGMAYLVRRLLENTASTSFLSAHGRGVPIEQLLAARPGDADRAGLHLGHARCEQDRVNARAVHRNVMRAAQGESSSGHVHV